MKANVSVGYSQNGLNAYHTKDFTNLTGADIKATDGLGNVIEVNVREEDIGYRISLNGKELIKGGK